MINSIDIELLKIKEIDIEEDLKNDLYSRFQAKDDGPCKIKGRITKKDNSNTLLIDLNIEQNLLIACFKCLDLVKFCLLNSLKEEIEEDDEYIINGKFNLENYIKDNIILNMPSSVYCKDDCKGLCSICGKNKNFYNCNCIDEFDLKSEKETENPFFRLDKLVKNNPV